MTPMISMTPRPPEPPAPAAAAEAPVIVDTVVVRRATRISSSFVRVELGGDGLAELGVEGPWLDQRIKLVFPGPSGEPPDLSQAGADWWSAYCALPEHERGAMRTYTVRDVLGQDRDTRLVVDIVVHDATSGPDGGPGASGPGNAWALAVEEGDRVLVVAPRQGCDFGGREFDPARAGRILLAADETAVPAVAGILRDLPAAARGTALLEVPVRDDVQHLDAPEGLSLVWLPREGAGRGERLAAALAEHLNLDPAAGPSGSLADTAEVDATLWETPTDALATGAAGDPDGEGGADLYAWIAGEAGVVTRLRRHLVHGRGLDRRQVAFMGYWREGVAMRA